MIVSFFRTGTFNKSRGRNKDGDRKIRHDACKILGVTNDATTREIRDGYLRKSLAHHPDRHPQSTAEERKRHEAEFKLVNNAYASLMSESPKKRKSRNKAKRSKTDKTKNAPNKELGI